MIEFEQPSKPEKKKKTPRWLWWVGGFILLGVVAEEVPAVGTYFFYISNKHPDAALIAIVVVAVLRWAWRRSKAGKNLIHRPEDHDWDDK